MNFIPIIIQYGCTQNCHFCSDKLMALKSIKYNDIYNQCKNFKNIFLCGSCPVIYNDGKYNLPSLISKIEKEIQNIESISVRQINLGLDHSLDTIKQIGIQDKCLKAIHIPIHSFSNTVLKYLNSTHTFANSIEAIELAILYDLDIILDIIVNTPVEEDDDFLKTYDFCNKYSSYKIDFKFYGWQDPKNNIFNKKTLEKINILKSINTQQTKDAKMLDYYENIHYPILESKEKNIFILSDDNMEDAIKNNKIIKDISINSAVTLLTKELFIKFLLKFKPQQIPYVISETGYIGDSGLLFIDSEESVYSAFEKTKALYTEF